MTYELFTNLYLLPTPSGAYRYPQLPTVVNSTAFDLYLACEFAERDGDVWLPEFMEINGYTAKIKRGSESEIKNIFK